MSAVQITLARDIRAGVWFCLGAALIIFLHALVGVGFAGYLAENRYILSFIKKLAIFIFVVLSAVFFYKGLRPRLEQESNRRGKAGLVGMAVASMNVLNIPFFFTISTILQAQGIVALQRTYGLFFMLGLSLGALGVLLIYVRFARFVATRAQFFARNLNYFLSGLFFLLAIFQWAQLYLA